MTREELLAALARPITYDMAIIGGGATGLGVALDAAARGFSVVLVESHDFASGTSSRATKLVHGGVRYLAQGNVALVREALHERKVLLRNAPHLAQPLAFVMPSYKLWETPFYGAGLKLYDALAGAAGLAPTRFLGRAETLAGPAHGAAAGPEGRRRVLGRPVRRCAAGARPGAHGGRARRPAGEPLRGHRAAARTGARGGPAPARTGNRAARSRCAPAAWSMPPGCGSTRCAGRTARPSGRTDRPMVAPSQGVHVVVDREFLPGRHALMIPKTADGRVLFGVPWLGKVILGTTDTPRADLPREPRPFPEELDFILGEAGRYLVRAPRPGRHPQPLGRPASAGQAAGRRRRRHQVAQPRAHRAGQPLAGWSR